MLTNEIICREAEELKEYTRSLRRMFHAMAEPSNHEFNTSARIQEGLNALGIPFVKVPGTGLIGIIDTGREGLHLVLRTDIDALPMPENECNLKGPRVVRSEHPDTACHACGHDAHMAMCLTAGKILMKHKDELNGIIYLCFEEGEENNTGWPAMLKELEKYSIDAVWGIHVWSAMNSGTLCVSAGPRMAGMSWVQPHFHGRGGHGSRPDLSINPVICASNFVVSTATALTQKVKAGQTVTYGLTSLQGGIAGNVIPDDCKVLGTFRFFDVEEGKKAVMLANKVAEDTADIYGCTVDELPDPDAIIPPTINDARIAGIMEKAFGEMLPEGTVVDHEPWYATETFANYLTRYPGVFMHLGIRNPEIGSGAEHHNTFFDVDEEVLPTGVACTVRFVTAMEENGLK